MNSADQHQENAREHARAAVNSAIKGNWERAAVFAQLAQAEAAMAQTEAIKAAIERFEWR